MIPGILLFALAGIGLLIACIIGVLGWVILKLFQGELNLKIGTDSKEKTL
jgi:hypothetical protein